MADRTERVILTADTEQFNTAMARAAATAKGLDVALDDLDGTQVDTQSSTEGLGKETEGLGKKQRETTKSTKAYTLEMALAEEKSARLRKELREQARAQLDLAAGIRETNDEVRSAGPEIDRFSGRLRLIADAAVTIGPALVPLGAAAIGGIAALAGQFSALAGGIGVTVLAMQGLGDAMKAVDKAQLEPTADNIQAMRIELEKLGPAGAAFVQYLQQISPQLSEIQMAARAGLFPGLEDGIDALLERAPQATDIVSQLATAMGDLARRTGEGLASDGFDQFFEYLSTDAAPTLSAFGESLGNVAEGIANLFVGFAPVSRDFSAGLVNMTERFAEWSRGLSENDGFASFVDYIRQSGPQAIDLLGSLAGAFAGIAEAAAPVGSAVMPVLTVMADALGSLARSDAGPVLFSLAAGLVAVNRATSGIASLSGTLSGAFAGVEAGASKSERALSALNRAGLALGGLAAAGAAMDLLGEAALDAAPNVEKLTATLIDQDAAAFAKEFGDIGAALKSLDPSGVDSVVRSFDELSEKGGIVGEALGTGLASFAGAQDDLVRVSQSADQASADFKSLDDALAGLVASAGPERATAMFDQLVSSQNLSADQTARLKGELPGFSSALQAAANTAALADDATRSLGDSLRYGADGAQSFSTALASLNGWLDKRAAIRNYEESLQGLAKGLRNGFKREDAENLDNTARGILQVAQAIKSPELREDFLAKARSSLSSLAKNSGPEARAEIQRVIGKMDELGLTRPTPKVRLDGGAAEAQAGRIRGELNELDRQRANPKAGLDDGAFTGTLRRTRGALTDLDRSSANPKVTAQGAGTALNSIQGVFNAITNLDGQTATVTTYFDKVTRFFTGPKSAEGNFFPANFFANGGIDRANAHEPELYRGGVTRIWGEPETQGEAYIPLANDHRRPRAKSILEATAAEMNGSVQWFATGGMSASADYYSRTSPTARLAADADFAGRKMREFGQGVERGEKGLKAELVARQKLLEKALAREEKEQAASKERLDALRQDAQSLRDSVESRLKSDLFQQSEQLGLTRPDNWNELSTEAQVAFFQANSSVMASLGQGQSPLDTLRADIERAREEGRLIQQLKARGLDGAALQSVIEGGNVSSAAGLSRKELREFERLYNQRERAVGATGEAASAAVFGRELRLARKDYQEQTAEVREVKKEQRETNRRLEKLEKAMERAADKAAKDVKDGINKSAANTKGGRS